MSKGSILIVEDSSIVVFHLKTTLEGEGYTVVGTCDSGETAIEFLETSPRPDLVLMDIMLNGTLDGIETASILRSRFNIPAVYITALTDKDTINRAKVTEPYGYLTKPFEDREIFAVIEMALYKHDIESRLRQSEEKYFSTVNSINDAVVTINRDFVVTFMNPSALNMAQWSYEEAVGRSVMEILNFRNELTHEINVNPIQCTLEMGNLNRMPDHLMLIGKHGAQIPMGESSLSPLYDTRGRFVGLIIVFKDLSDKVQQEKLLKEVERSRKAAIIEGQEQERSRIAKDLHDGLGQMLNAIKMNTRLIVRDSSAADSLLQLLDEAIIESVRISENLLPSKLRDFDLPNCLSTLSKNLSRSSNVRISFEAHGTDFDMSQSNKVNFYRIAQEALNNAIKHAQAKNISIQLSTSPDGHTMTIEDDGRGISFDRFQESKGRNGLINMRDRAEIMGGQFMIESDQQRGTFITVEVPFTNSELHA
jgi:PAS domain S-box-containing protein